MACGRCWANFGVLACILTRPCGTYVLQCRRRSGHALRIKHKILKLSAAPSPAPATVTASAPTSAPCPVHFNFTTQTCNRSGKLPSSGQSVAGTVNGNEKYFWLPPLPSPTTHTPHPHWNQNWNCSPHTPGKTVKAHSRNPEPELERGLPHLLWWGSFDTTELFHDFKYWSSGRARNI